ncbi:hypothetical protein G7Y89_g5883 [Cudoniella acicularis]|uniref:F-box domain-containing protein n=1 Tax=Cudoniella acicularis TaxID=354080 RepID=A0A8H4W5B4_9HELO|nr:hypothetical protein G7Y89_g5883 [Cudoniella acicularis]
MAPKHRRSSSDGDASLPISKRTRIKSSLDYLSDLSDELLIRILHRLPIQTLIQCQRLSHRFYKLAGDSQIWKNLYYNRFVLPRALRIPGMRTAPPEDDSLHFSSRRSKWLDDNTLVNRSDGKMTNWKGQYKLRHNWSIGACEVQEIHVADRPSVPAILVKLAEGVVLTVDKGEGLRVWDLKEKVLIAACALGEDIVPTCVAVDEESGKGSLGIAVGFLDGGWGTWKLDVKGKNFEHIYRNPASSNGMLSAIAFANPYILTITDSQLLSLYTFNPVPSSQEDQESKTKTQEDESETPEDTLKQEDGRSNILEDKSEMLEELPIQDGHRPNDQEHMSEILEEPTAELLPATQESSSTNPSKIYPCLLASLKSHTSWPPLSLSIRTTSSAIIASIAYSLPTYLSGYTIGLQELHLSPTTGLTYLLAPRLRFATRILLYSPLFINTLIPVPSIIRNDLPITSNNQQHHPPHYTLLLTSLYPRHAPR